MSERPTCIARLQIQAKATTCQKPSPPDACSEAPFQIVWLAIVQRSARPSILPSGRTAASGGSMTIAPATNIRNIQGEQTTANWASRLKPRMARVTTTAPTASTTRTKRMSSGYHFVCAGMPKSRRTAEAETVIIAPARMQYMTALHRL